MYENSVDLKIFLRGDEFRFFIDTIWTHVLYLKKDIFPEISIAIWFVSTIQLKWIEMFVVDVGFET